ncbi:hypothetical protein QBL02_00110 [Leucobacter sp. UT-8R-CII-1-4]|uniref:hypothetical protein n=1 Tax=Leucobacter sp. UT-8R-CII-1-4 TaxID=3040075 RepID=UPI0024A943D7|nr:hypothetical protein [Leucobacter sp. UT-8R-CII-1-4]MDI6021941.1 hypothetical protein [Leucobacter sp. UT-8R-CII-1-4]
MNTSLTRFDRITGVALIVLPLVALGFKMWSFGWYTVFMLFGPIFVMAGAYVMQVILAVQCYLVKSDLLGAARKRATFAAWLSSVGFLMLGITMPDGGDTGYGSTLQVWLGSYGANADAIHAATDTLTYVLAVVSAIAWVGGFVWLMIEWIGAHARRRKIQLGMA